MKTIMVSGGFDPNSTPPTRVLRPWGSYAVLAQGAGYKVKHITVDPHQGTSIQRHVHRDEHWISLEDSSVQFVPRGTWHQLRNLDNVPRDLIEVQVGPTCEEDDIERR